MRILAYAFISQVTCIPYYRSTKQPENISTPYRNDHDHNGHHPKLQPFQFHFSHSKNPHVHPVQAVTQYLPSASDYLHQSHA